MSASMLSTSWQRSSATPSCYKSRVTRVSCTRLRTKVQATTSHVEDMSSTISLANIRQSLIRQEDTIIFNFIERAQFAHNEAVYIPDAIPIPRWNRNGTRCSLFEFVLRETEQLHGSIRRYTSPDQSAFFPDSLPGLILPPISYPSVLAPCADSININHQIMDVYINDILKGITSPGDDFNYGSAATLDVLCVQALSTRIHFGKFVAEAKFRAQPQEYSRLIRAADSQAIMDLLTDKAVEARVVERVRLKAATFGQDVMDPASAAKAASAAAVGNGGAGADGEHQRRYKVSPDEVARVYEQWVMPLTKEVEVQYLLRRLDHEPRL